MLESNKVSDKQVKLKLLIELKTFKKKKIVLNFPIAY